jgi:transglutaminase superfamily protein
MKRLRKFLNLAPRDRRLLVSTTVLLGAIRLGLRLLPFRTMRRMVIKLAHTPTDLHPTKQFSVDRLAWAVTVASRYVPRATCLTQALAAQVLLGRHGHLSQLHVGVATGEEGRLEGHAWLESQGRIVVGGGELSRYTLLSGMEKDHESHRQKGYSDC